jgi:hypothetical protein
MMNLSGSWGSTPNIARHRSVVCYDAFLDSNPGLAPVIRELRQGLNLLRHGAETPANSSKIGSRSPKSRDREQKDTIPQFAERLG